MNMKTMCKYSRYNILIYKANNKKRILIFIDGEYNN